jgi:hypothetical protein
MPLCLTGSSTRSDCGYATMFWDGPHRMLDGDSAVATDLRLGGLWVSGLMDTPGR